MSAEPRAVEAAADQYAVGDAIPVETLAAVPDGTNLLVAGPSMLGIDGIALDLLKHGLRLSEHGVVITPDDPADRILSRFGGLADADDAELQIVDCCGAGGDDTDQVNYVATPGNLTDIGVNLTKATQAIGDRATAGVRVSMLSLSTLLHYNDLDTVFQFVHITTSRFAAAGYFSVATIDTMSHEPQTLNKLKAQFDGVVELREGSEGPEIRVVGLHDVPVEWEPF